MNTYSIVVTPMDGIGRQVIPLGVEAMKKAMDIVGGFGLEFKTFESGVEYYAKTQKAYEDGLMEAIDAADAVFAGSCGHYDPEMVKSMYPAYKPGSFLSNYLRNGIGNNIGLRPLKRMAGLDSPLKYLPDFNITLIRQMSEGNYKTPGRKVNNGTAAFDMTMVTRTAIEQCGRYAFEYASKGNGRACDGKKLISLANKHTVLRSMDFYRQIFAELAPEYPDVELEFVQVDALCERLIKDPSRFDVLVCENGHGDIVGDLGCVLIGGMGIAPTADIGGKTPHFRPNHGSFPRAYGKNFASPFAAINTGSYIFEVLGKTKNDENLTKASQLIIRALEYNFTSPDGKRTRDFGGNAATDEAAQAVLDAMDIVK